MNKAQLTAEVAEKLEVSKTEAGKVIDTVLGTIITSTVKDGECVIPGLGKLVIAKKAARSGVSKLGGIEKAWSTPEKNTIKLRLSTAGKELGN